MADPLSTEDLTQRAYQRASTAMRKVREALCVARLALALAIIACLLDGAIYFVRSG